MRRGHSLGLIALAVIVVAIAFMLLRPDDEELAPPPPPPGTEDTGSEDTTPERPKPKPKPTFEKIRIAGGEAAGGQRTITARKGDTVRIQVSSDTPDEIHLHGYDLRRKVTPARPARFTLKADIEGVFEIEAHDLGHVIVGELVVEP